MPPATPPAHGADQVARADAQALVCRHLTPDLSGLAFEPQPPTEPGPGQVRLQVLRVALNFPDLLMTQGLYHLRPELPFVPGMEGVGRVLALGPGLDAATLDGAPLRCGQIVGFGAKTGGLAEHAVLPATALRPHPENLSLDEGAAFFVTGLTAWVALARVGQLRAGETLLVHGARGGVGAACAQLGLHLGARVIATARDVATLAPLQALCGGRLTLLPADDGLADAVRAATGGRGVQVVADPVGGAVFDASIRSAAYGGRLLVLGFASGQLPQLKLQRLLHKGLTLHGIRAGEYGRQQPQAAVEHQAAVLRLARAGVLRPPVGAVFDFAQAVEALRAMQTRQVSGKIVVRLAD